jgi:hypothetical protein
MSRWFPLFFALSTVTGCGATPTPDLGESEATAECVPECGDRTCGDDGCGGTCGECKGDRECSDEGTCELPCPDHSQPGRDGTCTCDAGWLPDADCSTCERDVERDGCPADSFPNSGSCYCKLGLDVSEAGCGCEAAGSLGSSCVGDGDCATGRCMKDLSDFSVDGYYDFRGPLPGGFCSVDFCRYCSEWGGTCAAMGSDGTDSLTYACLHACTATAECRDGYVCRGIDPGEHFDADEAPGSFCLPPLR